MENLEEIEQNSEVINAVREGVRGYISGALDNFMVNAIVEGVHEEGSIRDLYLQGVIRHLGLDVENIKNPEHGAVVQGCQYYLNQNGQIESIDLAINWSEKMLGPIRNIEGLIKLSEIEDYTEWNGQRVVKFLNGKGIFTLNLTHRDFFSTYPQVTDDLREEMFESFATKVWNNSILALFGSNFGSEDEDLSRFNTFVRDNYQEEETLAEEFNIYDISPTRSLRWRVGEVLETEGGKTLSLDVPKEDFKENFPNNVKFFMRHLRVNREDIFSIEVLV